MHSKDQISASDHSRLALTARCFLGKRRLHQVEQPSKRHLMLRVGLNLKLDLDSRGNFLAPDCCQCIRKHVQLWVLHI